MSVGDSELRGRGPVIEGPTATLTATPRLPLSVHSVGLVVAVFDLAIIVLTAVVSAVAYHAVFLGSSVNLERYAAIGAVCFLNFAVIASAKRLYRVDALLRFRRQARDVAATWAIVITVSLSLVFVVKVGEDVSRGAVALFFVTGMLALLAWRRLLGLWIAKAVEAGTLGTKLVVLIADREELSNADTVRQIRRAGYAPAATLTYGTNPSAKTLHELVDHAIQIAKNEPVDSIMIMANWSDARAIEQVANSLRVLPLPVYLLPDHRTARFLKGGMSAIAGLTVAEVQRAPLSNAERVVKRVFDVALSSAGLFLLSPLLAIVAALVRLDSHGPAFFWQTRNGFNGRAFRILKFRSMTVTDDGAAVRQATREDPRITRLGRLLRKTSIDELPQLWNVLKGDMSIVGPRPHATAHNEEYQKFIGSYAYRHHMKPGLTGWAQVHGLRGETKSLDLMQRRVEHDLYYVNHWSIALDVLIVLLTIRVLFRDPSAY